jgi:hypothetical protein
MARHGKGILGDFSGKVGTVVGGNWNGVPYMRSLPVRKKNRSITDAQQNQQVKFALGIRFIKSLSPLLAVSYQSTSGKTNKNVALSQLMAQAVGGVYPNVFIDFSKVVVAKGSLKKADNPNVATPGTGLLRFNWADNTGLGNGTALDKAILVAYCPEKEDCIFTVDGGNRSQGMGILDVSFFAGKEVHTWISFRSPDGKLAADSTYIGSVLVP